MPPNHNIERARGAASSDKRRRNVRLDSADALLWGSWWRSRSSSLTFHLAQRRSARGPIFRKSGAMGTMYDENCSGYFPGCYSPSQLYGNSPSYPTEVLVSRYTADLAWQQHAGRPSGRKRAVMAVAPKKLQSNTRRHAITRNGVRHRVHSSTGASRSYLSWVKPAGLAQDPIQQSDYQVGR